jgi:hypothetical protein
MKTIFLLLLCSITYAQQITEKWNEYEKRYEYFDSSGKMTAYKSYNRMKNNGNTSLFLKKRLISHNPT